MRRNSIVKIFLFVLLVSCKVRKPKNFQPVQLVSIEAIDLSEDRSILSTHNDEVLVSIIHATIDDHKWSFSGHNLPTIVFDTNSRKTSIHDVSLKPADSCLSCEVWVCLSEIDEDNTEDTTLSLILSLLNTTGYKALDSKFKVDAIIKDNDFLGVIKLPNSSPDMPMNYLIKGSDLRDKYEYKLTISTMHK